MKATTIHLSTLFAAALTFFALGMNAARLRPLVNSISDGIHWELIASLIVMAIFSAVFAWDRRSGSLAAALLWYEAKCIVIWSMFTLGWALTYDHRTGPSLSNFFILLCGWWCSCAIAGGIISVARRVADQQNSPVE